jgi:hypothetical protein
MSIDKADIAILELLDRLNILETLDRRCEILVGRHGAHLLIFPCALAIHAGLSQEYQRARSSATGAFDPEYGSICYSYFAGLQDRQAVALDSVLCALSARLWLHGPGAARAIQSLKGAIRRWIALWPWLCERLEIASGRSHVTPAPLLVRKSVRTLNRRMF